MNICPPNILLRALQTAARLAVVVQLGSLAFAADSTNAVASFPPVSVSPALPDVGTSLVRVMGGLALVLSLFLGGVWLFRNWQRLMVQRGRAPKLNVLEVRALGGRQSIYVVAYEQERFLLSSSPNGVNFLSHLPASEESATEKPPTLPTPSFAQALKQVLGGK